MSTYDVAGRQVALPVEVREATAMTAMFVTSADAVRDVVDGTGLAPAVLPGGRALAILAAIHYVDNDLGAYDEVALAFPVEPPAPTEPRGAYIHRLPVNGEFTCAAGRRIWGFPKWVCDIDVAVDERGGTCELRDGGELVMRLETRRRPFPLPSRPAELTAYSYLDGVVRRTPFTSRSERVRGGPGGARLEVGLRHPMARELRALGLPRRALASSTVGLLRASFGAPVEVPVSALRRGTPARARG